MGMIQSSINNLLTIVSAGAALSPDIKDKLAKQKGIQKGKEEVAAKEVVRTAEQEQRQKDIEKSEAAYAQKHKQYAEDTGWKTGAKGQAKQSDFMNRRKIARSLQDEAHGLWMATGKQEYYDIQATYAKDIAEYEEGFNKLKRPPKDPQSALENAQDEQRNGKMNGGNK